MILVMVLVRSTNYGKSDNRETQEKVSKSKEKG